MAVQPTHIGVRVVALVAGTVLVLGGCAGGAGGGGSHSAGAGATASSQGRPLQPVSTSAGDWQGVAGVLGPGKMAGEAAYKVSFPRTDLQVRSRGVGIDPSLALGSYAAFARYRDGKTLMMGDLVVTDRELNRVTDALQEAGIAQTAVHKHLLAHQPDLWWTHIRAVGPNPVKIARGVRAVLGTTATPVPAQQRKPTPQPRVGLDTRALNQALGTSGKASGGVYKAKFTRAETVTASRRVLPPALGGTTALGFQPTGGEQAAVNGDFVMTAGEVQPVIQALRAGGIKIASLHNHALGDQPRLFYLHFWARGDAVELAKTLRQAVEAHNVQPAS